MNKQILRTMFLEKRKTLTPQEHAFRSELVCQQAISFIGQKTFRNIHLFLPIVRQKEVNTIPIFNWLLENKQYKVILPKVAKSSGQLEHIEVNSPESLEKGNFGILEPKEGKPFDILKIDLVLTPLVSFDRKGHRIGYGGGFYDRFFDLLPKKTAKVGLAITPPLDSIIYSELHDIPLDACINHHGTYNFKS